MPAKSPKTNKPAITVSDLSVAFGNERVLEGISFQIKEGQVAAIIGPNGSGKTTLLKAILGLTRYTGTIHIFDDSLEKARTFIGYVPQRFTFDRQFPITTREFLALGLHKNAKANRIEETTKEVGLAKETLEQPLGTLSGGQLQRALIAQAIQNKPKLLVLDEPSAGVDIEGERVFYNIVKDINTKEGTTILLVSHEISLVASFVDQVVCVNRKLLCYGPPEKTLTEPRLKELFGKHQSLYEHNHCPYDHRD